MQNSPGQLNRDHLGTRQRVEGPPAAPALVALKPVSMAISDHMLAATVRTARLRAPMAFDDPRDGTRLIPGRQLQLHLRAARH